MVQFRVFGQLLTLIQVSYAIQDDKPGIARPLNHQNQEQNAPTPHEEGQLKPHRAGKPTFQPPPTAHKLSKPMVQQPTGHNSKATRVRRKGSNAPHAIPNKRRPRQVRWGEKTLHWVGFHPLLSHAWMQNKAGAHVAHVARPDHQGHPSTPGAEVRPSGLVVQDASDTKMKAPATGVKPGFVGNASLTVRKAWNMRFAQARENARNLKAKRERREFWDKYREKWKRTHPKLVEKKEAKWKAWTKQHPRWLERFRWSKQHKALWKKRRREKKHRSVREAA